MINETPVPFRKRISSVFRGNLRSLFSSFREQAISRATDNFFIGTLFIQPVLFTLLSVGIYRYGGKPNLSLYAVIGAGMIGFVLICYFLFKDKLVNIIMRVGIIFYMLALNGTTFLAIGNLNTEITTRAILISVGAFLFLISDLFLGIHYFRKAIKGHESVVWPLYASGQLLIALSCFY